MNSRLSRTHLAYIALTLSSLFWSGNFIAGRALRGEVDPLTLNALRWSICLLLFLPFVGRSLVAKRHVILKDWKRIAALGASGMAAFHTFVYMGLTTTTAINALLITSLVPAAILVGSTITGTGKPTAIQWTGALVSLAGVGVIVTRGSVAVLLGLHFTHGDLWMLASVVVWVVYSLLLRHPSKDLSADTQLAASIAVAVVILVPLALVLPPATSLAFDLPVWGAIGYIGVFAGLLAFRFWSFGVHGIGPERAGQFVHLMPLFGSVMAVAFLGETLEASQIAGAVLVLAGILLVNRKRHAIA